MTQLEVCCGDLLSLHEAKKGGAERIELCTALAEGGLTPSIGLIREAVKAGFEEINVLIRPRGGDFLYSDEEIHLMDKDIKEAIMNGATGIVIGALTSEGYIDKETMYFLISKAREYGDAKGRHINLTFHRAFDLCKNPQESLEDLVSLNCDCLLTSGMSPDAYTGIPEIKKLMKQADGRIRIMAGSGINEDNISEIVMTTGVPLIHSTAKKKVKSKMKFRREDVAMGSKMTDEYSYNQTSASIVAKLLEKLNS